jgi:hypothetical protein
MAALLTLVLLAAAIAVIAAPLLSRHRAVAAEPGDGAERAELQSAREAKYREIADAEFDYRTGKLSREDHEAVDAALRAEALRILDALQALEAIDAEKRDADVEEPAA